MVFKTKHFSNYIIVEEMDAISNPPTGDSILSYVMLSCMSFIGCFVALISRKKHKTTNV